MLISCQCCFPLACPRYLVVLGFSGSSNMDVTSYYEAINFEVPSNRPKYRALENDVSDSVSN